MTNQSGCLPRYEDMTETRGKYGERGHTWEPLVPLEIIWNYFIFRPDWIYNFDKYFPVLTSRWRCWMLNMMNEIFIRIKHRLGACQRWDVYFAQISGRKPAVLKFRSSSQPSPPPQHWSSCFLLNFQVKSNYIRDIASYKCLPKLWMRQTIDLV